MAIGAPEEVCPNFFAFTVSASHREAVLALGTVVSQVHLLRFRFGAVEVHGALGLLIPLPKGKRYAIESDGVWTASE
jgi:hypothetical protein